MFENDNASEMPPGLNDDISEEEESHYPTRADFKFSKRKIQPVLDPIKMGLRISPAKIRMVK